MPTGSLIPWSFPHRLKNHFDQPTNPPPILSQNTQQAFQNHSRSAWCCPLSLGFFRAPSSCSAPGAVAGGGGHLQHFSRLRRSHPRWPRRHLGAPGPRKTGALRIGARSDGPEPASNRRLETKAEREGGRERSWHWPCLKYANISHFISKQTSELLLRSPRPGEGSLFNFSSPRPSPWLMILKKIWKHPNQSFSQKVRPPPLAAFRFGLLLLRSSSPLGSPSPTRSQGPGFRWRFPGGADAAGAGHGPLRQRQRLRSAPEGTANVANGEKRARRAWKHHGGWGG